jgi:hypothetical protein
MRPFLFSDNLFPECPIAVRRGGLLMGLTTLGDFYFWEEAHGNTITDVSG